MEDENQTVFLDGQPILSTSRLALAQARLSQK
jgi:hypothetical protein